jgi:hypothetical protein
MVREKDTAEALDVDIGAYVQKISSLDERLVMAAVSVSLPWFIYNYGILWGYRISRKLASYIKLGLMYL